MNQLGAQSGSARSFISSYLMPKASFSRVRVILVRRIHARMLAMPARYSAIVLCGSKSGGTIEATARKVASVGFHRAGSRICRTAFFPHLAAWAICSRLMSA